MSWLRNPKLATTGQGRVYYTKMSVYVSQITHAWQCLCHTLHGSNKFSIQLHSHSILALIHAWALVTFPRSSQGSQAPWYPSQAALWAYSGTGDGTQPGHTKILRLRNL